MGLGDHCALCCGAGLFRAIPLQAVGACMVCRGYCGKDWAAQEKKKKNKTDLDRSVVFPNLLPQK